MIYRLYSNLYYYIYGHDRFLCSLVNAIMRLHQVMHGKIGPLAVNGKRINVHPNDLGISAELALFNVHEPISTKLLTENLKKGDYCLEVGANIGYYTLLTAGVIGEEGKIIVTEPHPENFSRLLENISMNNLENVLCFSMACSSYDGHGKMKTTVQSNWHSLLEDGKNGGLQVEVRKADTLARDLDLDRLDFIRMDVEGHEDRVIRVRIRRSKL